MSKNLERVIQRAISDAAFRRQLQSNPEAALRGFKLTQSEVAALRSGDAGKLTSLGIDQRMSKTFTFSAGEAASRQVAGGDLSSGSSLAVDSDSATAASSMVIPGDTGSASGIGDPGAERGTASRISDPDNPASSRGYIGDQAASPSSDAIEDQSHAFSASRDQGASTTSGVIADPDNPASARSYTGDQLGGSATSSKIGDPDNPLSARGYVGDQSASSTSDAIEDQSHAFAANRSADVNSSGMAAPMEGSPEEFAFRDQASSATSASKIGDPDNPLSSRGYVGDQTSSSTSDALEDQSHAFSATRSADASGSGTASIDSGGDLAAKTDAFLTPGEIGQYSDAANWSSDQAEDAHLAFNPDGSTAVVDDGDTTVLKHEPDQPI